MTSKTCKSKGDEKEDCEKESEEEELDEGWEIWTDPLEELGDMIDVFKVNKLRNKTVLDVGTNGVKPLYIALKYKPHKIIGITLEKYRFTSAIAEDSRFLVETEMHFHTGNFLNNIDLARIKEKENIEDTFDFILISKTLHHLRTGECVAKIRRCNHTCIRQDEKFCVYKFEEKEIFERFFKYGKKVIVYEYFEPDKKDPDKSRGKGGHFTIPELRRILTHLSSNYKVELFKPLRRHLVENEMEEVMRELKNGSAICFSVGKSDVEQ